MTDRLTQAHPFPQPRKRGLAVIRDFFQRFHHAYRSLPQVQSVRREGRCLWRRLSGGLHFLFFRFWVRFAPFAARQWQRFAAWFLQTPPVCAVRSWWRSVKQAVWELPQYQFLRRVHLRFNACPPQRFLFYLLLLVLLELPICLFDRQAQSDTHIYMLLDGGTPQAICGYPTQDYVGTHVLVRSGSRTRDAQIILSEGQCVTVRHGESTQQVAARHETVANLLRRMELVTQSDEMVVLNSSGDTLFLHITKELRCERNEKSFSPYNTRMFSNYLLEKGTHRIVQKGRVGVVTDTYADIYRMGQMVSSRLIGRSDSSAVTQIVEYGKLTTTMEQDCRAVEDHPFRNGSEGGYLIFENGESMVYTKKVVNNSTAYYGGTHTATGHKVGRGVIAVDPGVYPYRTSMYIGAIGAKNTYYGIGTAYDCGGSVKGNIIDVWFPTYGECAVWGRRSVTCYVLEATKVT